MSDYFKTEFFPKFIFYVCKELYFDFDVIPNREFLFKSVVENSNWFVLTAIPRKERMMQILSEKESEKALETYTENKYKWFEAHNVPREKN